MPSPTLDTLPDGALVVAADTTEEALAHVSLCLGDDAEITEARRVHRGGWKGFFAHEVVQLTARPRSGATPAPGSDGGARRSPGNPAPATLPVDADGVAAALSRMTALVDQHERTFQDVLAGHLDPDGRDGAEPVTASASPREASPAAGPSRRPTGPTAPRPVCASGPAWHLDQLRALQLPNAVIDACQGLNHDDDVAWIATIAAAVATWCRPLPVGDPVFVGPRAHRLGKALAVPVAEPGDVVAASGPVALKATDTDAHRAWLERVTADRWRHLVAGGRGWHGLLLDDALAVSWAGDEALPGALAAAGRLGLVLGYGLGTPTGRSPVRATPVDVALAVRSLLPRTIA